ncbi:helix-turn-helix domain-containing protein [Microbacterium marinilacus]|uniref:TetR family transcriptional regulator BioQ n=1 Tax=Microbacterium marinilacus TaxID=415209 RepID=A0ABP7BJL9_9MICO|nr:helix-turn-helix domain-containing protein [Microbacterium marinilacus]MBY0690349.1 TetR/AcrR family transcriptional regulator [Microbacterium marinilacus]
MESRDARTERHTRDGIVDTALALLQRAGLPDLSMRRLAAELGVQPSALYWHFDNKQSLLADIADRIVASAAPVAPSAEPAADVAAAASALRDALLAYRDGAEIVLSTQALGLGSDVAHDRLAGVLAPLAGDDAQSAATVLLQFVLGHASLVQQRIQAARFGAYPAAEAEVVEQTASDFARGVRMLVGGYARG